MENGRGMQWGWTLGIAALALLALPTSGLAQAPDAMPQERLGLALETKTAVSNDPAERMARTVLIERDSWGIPHISGPTDAAAAFGLAYAQAEDNFALLEDGFIRSLGRAAEVRGKRSFEDDKLARLLEVPKLAREEYRQAPAPLRALLDAYAMGLDFYLKRHPEVRPALLTHFEPWYPMALIRFKYYIGEFLDYAGIDPDTLEVYTPAIFSERPHGSNGWAVAPSKTASGHAFLLMNPHVGFYGVAPYYEAHVQSAEGWNFSGVARYGLPMPYIGHNERLGWTYTDDYPDIGDLYVEHFDKLQEPLAYRYGTSYRQALEWTETIQVRGDAGMTSETVRFRRTHHGPIVSTYQGSPVAVRLARMEEGGWFEQWYAMSKAHNWKEFHAALAQMAVSYMNVTYADADGNIFYLYGGSVPRRDDRFDWRRPVDGSDPATEWKGLHSVDELPQVLNPKAGYVKNTNSSPFFTTSPSGSDNPDPKRFPRYMVGPEFDNPRSKVSRRILESQPKFTFDEFTRLATDTRIEEAERLVPILLAEFDRLRVTDPRRAEALAPLVESLRGWDRVARIDSIPTTLFVRLHPLVVGGGVWWNPIVPKFPEKAAKPEEQNPFPLMAGLEAVRDALQKSWGTWKVAWGEVNRHQRLPWDFDFRTPFHDDQPSLPVPGTPNTLGLVFAYNAWAPAPATPDGAPAKRRYGISGDSFVSVVEFGPQPQARAIFYYGQSGNPSSPHYFDQAPLYARGELRPAWFSREEIAAHLEKSYHPGEK